MSRRLLLDEMFSPRIAIGLRTEARCVQHCGATRAALAADPEVLELATAEQRILVTFNIKDF